MFNWLIRRGVYQAICVCMFAYLLSTIFSSCFKWTLWFLWLSPLRDDVRPDPGHTLPILLTPGTHRVVTSGRSPVHTELWRQDAARYTQSCDVRTQPGTHRNVTSGRSPVHTDWRRQDEARYTQSCDVRTQPGTHRNVTSGRSPGGTACKLWTLKYLTSLCCIWYAN